MGIGNKKIKAEKEQLTQEELAEQLLNEKGWRINLLIALSRISEALEKQNELLEEGLEEDETR